MNLTIYPKLAFLLVLVLGHLSAFAQLESEKGSDTNKQLTYELEIGYLIGGSGTVYFFTYNSALNFNLSIGKQIKETAIIQASIGTENNQDGVLFPFSIDLKKYLGKTKNHYLEGHAGYSFGRLKNGSSLFSYRGGPLGGIAYGYNIASLKQAKIYTQIGYKLRQSKIGFQAFDTSRVISNKLDNHFLSLQFGIQF